MLAGQANTAREEFRQLDLACANGSAKLHETGRRTQRDPPPSPAVTPKPKHTNANTNANAAAAGGGGSGPDPCFDVLYADKNYGDCCGSGNYKKPGHQSVCHELQKERRAEGEAKNIDYHKEPPDSKVLVIEGDLFFERVAKRHDVRQSALSTCCAVWCFQHRHSNPPFHCYHAAF